ncbi:hypothetical protein SBOR_3127 [Sclerotinia borealis F-4128]|uniref:N-acetyltransferase domain-containing protein n=1 Tax=Sclerotinia borealis (strain F-4128) TaxID=1432307 RepID=W9CPS4_SCLBF|nr:hypothetical protein SBOR_3127 [Sclerotinia borealis F-4128]
MLTQPPIPIPSISLLTPTPSTPNPAPAPNPNLTLHPCTLPDLHTIAYLEYLAFKEDEFSDLAFGVERGSSEALRMRAGQFEGLLGGEIEKGDSEEGENKCWYVKAVIGGEVVGVAGWSLGGGEGKGGKEERKKANVGEKREGDDGEKVQEVPKEKTKEELEKIWGKGCNAKLCEDVFVKGDQYMFEACGELNILLVHPQHQRLGIGTQLLTQGLQLADEKALQVVLGASPWGIGLYRKFGFVEVHVMDIRLRDYVGGEGMGGTSHVVMWRAARGEEEDVREIGGGDVK